MSRDALQSASGLPSDYKMKAGLGGECEKELLELLGK